jgi:signal transduction histidine kinase
MGQAAMKQELRVLMLEDTPSDADLAERELRKAGVAFISMRVESRDAFIRALGEFRPDIVLSDYKLPNFDGRAALEIVQRNYPDVPVVMVTGALSDMEAVDLIHAGARDYVLKDRLARLAPAVQRALAAAQDARARSQAEERLRQLNESLEQQVKEQTQKNMEKERLLIEQNRSAAMGELIRNIAHQWRQPLNTVALVVQNILDDYGANRLKKEELEKNVGTAMRCIKRMSKTIDDFRDFFRPDKTKKLFKLHEAIEESLVLIEATLKNNEITVSLSGDQELQAFGYANEFSHIILNLLANAADALADNKVQQKRIEIELRSSGPSGIVVIRDNAGGIPEEAMGRIFDPYFTTKVDGLGIGLYMSKIIIEKHIGGSISFCNAAHGAEFTISIPLSSDVETKLE